MFRSQSTAIVYTLEFLHAYKQLEVWFPDQDLPPFIVMICSLLPLAGHHFFRGGRMGIRNPLPSTWKSWLINFVCLPLLPVIFTNPDLPPPPPPYIKYNPYPFLPAHYFLTAIRIASLCHTAGDVAPVLATLLVMLPLSLPHCWWCFLCPCHTAGKLPLS